MAVDIRDTNPAPRTHNALVDYYHAQFKAGVERGDYEPYVWPYRSFGIYVLLAYMLLPPTENKLVRHAKYPVFVFFAYWCIRAIFETKSASLPATYGIGLVDAWAIVWCAVFVIFRDLRDVRRVERRPVAAKEFIAQDPVADGVTTAVGVNEKASDGAGARMIKTEKASPASFADVSKISGNETPPGPSPDSANLCYTYFWQSLPASFLARLDFILDLLFAMRGPGWSHQSHAIPSPPAYISRHLQPPPPQTHPTSRSYPTTSSLLRANLLGFLWYYLLLDMLKTYTLHDAYFLGHGSLLTSPYPLSSVLPTSPPAPPLPPFLPLFLTRSPSLSKWLRLLLALLTTRLALGLIFTLSPLFFVGVLGTRALGLRAEPWLYADFGGYFSHLYEAGLAGWWSRWWHQIFRVGFKTPGLWACGKLGLNTRGKRGRLLCVGIAFGISGVLHAAGSRTMLPETDPLRGPLLFFALQAVGVVGEGAVRGWLGGKERWRHGVPRSVKEVFTFVWVAGWMYYTAPLVVDDFSKGGNMVV